MLKKKTHIHFVGIGGIGMSGIAKVLAHQGYKISGCDANINQKSIRDLLALGCTIHEGNNHPLCDDQTISTIVYTSDVQNLSTKINHPELLRAHERGIALVPRGVMLGELSRTKYTITVAGSHGKTTTTSLLSHIFIEAKADPTILVGGHLQSISSNARYGKGDFLIAESDESDRSLLHLHPTLAILTNIDREHLNTYQNIHDLAETFRLFLEKIPFYGKAFVCIDDPYIRSLLPLAKTPYSTYGTFSEAEWSYTDAILEADKSHYTVLYRGKEVGKITVRMPGRHNILNSLAAVAASLETGLSFDVIAQALATFEGVDRRFTLKGTFQGAEVFDDYGHHPTEIQCTATVARKRAKNKVILIFQPHRYSRLSTLWKDFANMLATLPVDELLVTDIYAANEQAIPGLTGEALVDLAKKLNPQAPITYLPLDLDNDFLSIRAYLSSKAQDGDIILLQGAGNINKIAPFLTQK